MEDPEDPKDPVDPKDPKDPVESENTFWKTVNEAVELINKLVPICEALNGKGQILPIDEDNFIRLNASLQFVKFVFPEQVPEIDAIRKEVIFANKNLVFLAEYDILEP